jgi:RNA polymerase sigma-70 factor (ECF subfamily)
MIAAILITDGDLAPKSNPCDRDGGDKGVSSRARPCQDRHADRERVVSLYDGPGAATDQAAFADCVEAIALSADKAAFARLFAHFAPRLKSYLMRLGLEPAQAEEVAQEVMVTVWRKAASFDRKQASVATWVFRIARNRRIDVFRRDQRAMLDVHDPAFQPQGEASPDASTQVADREAQVRLAMAELPADQRELVRAHFYEDLTHSQIAERTGVPLGTVKSRLRLAFGKLRLKLETFGAGIDL